MRGIKKANEGTAQRDAFRIAKRTGVPQTVWRQWRLDGRRPWYFIRDARMLGNPSRCKPIITFLPYPWKAYVMHHEAAKRQHSILHNLKYQTIYSSPEVGGPELDLTVLQIRAYCKQCCRFLNAREIRPHLHLA